MNNTKKLELVITALKQSLARKVADYEEELASIRAEASIMLEEQANKISVLEEKVRKGEENANVAVPEEE